MATGDHEYRNRDQEEKDLQRVFFSGSENYLQNFTRTYAPPPGHILNPQPAEFTVANLPHAARVNHQEADLDIERTNIKWCPGKCAFEVSGKNLHEMVPQEMVLKSVLKIAKELKLLDDQARHIADLKENILSLVNTCEDDSCEEEKLCDRCIMIKGWADGV